MFVGPAEPRDESELLFQEDDRVEFREWNMSPIFRKIFDEVFVNALDAAARDESVRKVAVTYEDGLIYSRERWSGNTSSNL